MQAFTWAPVGRFLWAGESLGGLPGLLGEARGYPGRKCLHAGILFRILGSLPHCRHLLVDSSARVPGALGVVQETRLADGGVLGVSRRNCVRACTCVLLREGPGKLGSGVGDSLC
jgi:hypothetical protein